MSKKSKAPASLTQKYAYSYGLLQPDGRLYIKTQNLTTLAEVEETFTIDDPELRARTHDIIGSPLEEMAWGLYGDNITLKEIVDSTIAQAKDQLSHERAKRTAPLH